MEYVMPDIYKHYSFKDIVSQLLGNQSNDK